MPCVHRFHAGGCASCGGALHESCDAAQAFPTFSPPMRRGRGWITEASLLGTVSVAIATRCHPKRERQVGWGSGRQLSPNRQYMLGPHARPRKPRQAQLQGGGGSDGARGMTSVENSEHGGSMPSSGIVGSSLLRNRAASRRPNAADVVSSRTSSSTPTILDGRAAVAGVEAGENGAKKSLSSKTLSSLSDWATCGGRGMTDLSLEDDDRAKSTTGLSTPVKRGLSGRRGLLITTELAFVWELVVSDSAAAAGIGFECSGTVRSICRRSWLAEFFTAQR